MSLKSCLPRTGLLFALTVLLIPPLYGSELPDTVKGFRPQTLEVYFSRADQERASMDWERVAKFGAEAAVSEWERTAFQLYSEPSEVTAARGELADWVGVEMEKRYESWLTRRFFDQQGSLGSSAILRAIADANMQYLYTTDAFGAIQLDESGDPILKGVEGLEADRENWDSKVGSAADMVLAAWEQRVDAAFAPELGGLLGSDGLARYDEYKVSVKAGLRREMERLSLQGELSFVSRRLYDQYSLRKKSESATADAIVKQIVQETRAQTDAGIAAIKAGLSETPEAVDSSSPAIDVDRWIESFTTAFEGGLSRWDSAEEKFLTSRMEWERDAGKSYTEGEKAWTDAYQRLTTERRAWEKEVDSLLQSGAARWDQAQSELASAIEGARAEFQKERDERVAGMQDQVGALVDMYAQSLQVISTALSSGQDLVRKLGIKSSNGEYVTFSTDAVPAIDEYRRQKWGGYIAGLDLAIVEGNALLALLSWLGPDDSLGLGAQCRTRIAASSAVRFQMASVDPTGPLQGDDSVLALALRSYTAHLRQFYGDSSGAGKVTTDWERLGRLDDWLTMIDTYQDYADEAQRGLRNALGSAFGAEATDLRDVLKTDADSGIAYLDDYQLELLRAKAVQDYWSQRKAVADAVVAYAQDISGGRRTADQSAKAYSAASDAYEARLASYNQTLELLKGTGVELSLARHAMEEAQAAVDEVSADYETARQGYLDALVAAQSGNVEFYQGQIAQRYGELLDASGISGADAELADASVQYFAAARRYGLDLCVQSAWECASELVQGNPERAIVSIAELKTEAQRIHVPVSVDAIPPAIEDLGISLDSPLFQTTTALYAAWRDSPVGIGKALAGWKLVRFVSMAAANAQAACAERTALIKAYAATDVEAWYQEAGGKCTSGSVEDRLAGDSLGSALGLIRARAETELRGLAALVQIRSGETPADEEALMLANAASPTLGPAESAARIAGLQSLIAALSGLEVDPASAVLRMRETVAAGGWIQSFIHGEGSFLDAQAGDLALALCPQEYMEAERARRVASAWGTASRTSPALANEREDSALAAIKGVFGAKGLTVGENGVLPSSEDIAAAISAKGAVGAAGFVGQLKQELESAASNGPRWLSERVGDYCDALAGYAAASAVFEGVTQSASARADAASARATAAEAVVADLRDVMERLQGGDRLTALVDLHTRSDAPSAFAVSARSLVVEAVAVQTAKRSLTSPGVALDLIVKDLAPGLAGPLAQSIALRAEELLLTNRGQGQAGQKAAAYRVWNTVSADDAIGGVEVNPLAAEAKGLWDEVASRSWPDQQSLRSAIDAYLSSHHPASAEIVGLCEQLEAGLESPEDLFRVFVFGTGFDELVGGLGAMGAAGEVYKRALVLRIAAQLDNSVQGRELAGFLRDRSGIQSAGDAEGFAGANVDLSTAAFYGAGDDALEYLCKTLLLEGRPIPQEVEARLSATPSVGSRVEAFRDKLRSVRGYVGAVDGLAQSYARTVGGSLEARCELVAAIASGQWQDELFAARSCTSYLEWYEGLVDCSLDAACQVVTEELARRSAALSAEVTQCFCEESLWRLAESAAAEPGSWRDHLTPSTIGALSVGTALTSQTRDTGKYFRATGSPAANLVLESFNELVGQETAFRDQVAVDRADPGTLNRFHEFVDAFVAGSAEEADLPLPGEQAFQTCESTYRSALARISALKDDIRRFGESLQLLDLDSASRQQQLDGLRLAMGDLADGVASRQAMADKALRSFEDCGQVYNDAYARLQDDTKQLEQARYSLRVQQEIQDWASNGYLAPAGETSDAYLSPAQNQANVAEKLLRSTAALNALKELYGVSVTDRPVGDPATLAAYESWKRQYDQLLGINRLVGQLDDAVGEQTRKVQDQYDMVQEARKLVLKWDYADAALGFSWLTDASERARNWSSYLTLRDGQLSLNITGNFRLQVQSTEAEWNAMRMYFEDRQTQTGDPPETAGKSVFERQMEAWTATVVALAARFGGMDALIDRWGSAADWLKRRLYDANSTDAVIGAAVKDLLGHYSKDDDFLRSPDLMGYSGRANDYPEDAIDFLAPAVSGASANYRSVAADSSELQAFEFYLAIRMASNNDQWRDQFNSRTTCAALGAFSLSVQDRIDTLRDNASAPLGGFGDAINGWSKNADALERIDDKIQGVLNGLEYATGSGLMSSIGTFVQARTSYETSCARLAALRGTGGPPMSSIDTFLWEYRKLLALEKGVAMEVVVVPSDLESSFRSKWIRLSTEDRTSFGAALKRMELLGRADCAEAHRTALAVAADARTVERAAQQRYGAAFEAFLSGTGTETELVAAALPAFRDSAWVGKAEQELTSNELDSVSFSAGSLFNSSEASARLDAVGQYAQSVVAACASALDSRGAALDQGWSQACQDLGDRRESWYAQVGLVRAKAESAWESSQQKLVRSWGEWKQGFENEYAQKSEAWRLSYLNLGQRKLDWVQEAQIKAGAAGKEAILSEVGAGAEDVSRDASTMMISQMSFDSREASRCLST